MLVVLRCLPWKLFLAYPVMTLFMVKEVNSQAMPQSNITQQALTDLRELLYTQEEWIKVHVAEFLLWEGQCVDEVRREFLEENRRYGHIAKYRIGIWRVLAQATSAGKERSEWVNRIVKAYEETEGPDRLHAVETLAKLKHAVVADISGFNISNGSDAFTLYRIWNAAYQPNANVEAIHELLVSLLEIQAREYDERALSVSSFVIRNLRPVSPGHWDRIRECALAFSGSYGIRSALLATVSMTALPGVDAQYLFSVKRELLAMKNKSGVLVNLLYVLAESATEADRLLLSSLYARVRKSEAAGYDADIHAAAAYAVLKTNSTK